MEEFDIAIVGGGAGGALAALHLLRLEQAPLRIVLVEARPMLAQGVAYATDRPEHVLNVPALGMSAFDDAPGDFVAYLAEAGAESEVGTTRDDPATMEAPPAARFIERRRYGRYLRDRLDRARAAGPARLEFVHDRVVSLASGGTRATNVTDDTSGMNDTSGAARLRLASGAELRARGVVLALGNAPKPLPARGAAELPPGVGLQAWDYDAITDVDAEEEVCIVGSGLSMVDTVLSLAARGHRGTVHVLSRHALLPQPHASTRAALFDVEAMLAMDLRRRVRHLREQVREARRQGLPWQAVMERLRPHGQALWQSLSLADQRRFLRHLVRFWDVHRHRIAAPVHARLQALLASGRLRLHRGRLRTVECESGRILLRATDGRGGERSLRVDRVVNATGTELRARTMRNPLLDDLLDQGIVQPGPHGIGIKVAADGSAVDAEGEILPWLQVLGGLRAGCLWETTAVPELRGQAENAARRLLRG